ncbi:MAG: hypothetical protein JW850_20300 [Thermoflexales bacterium]|nr:hypothetical protein [Thermoflexales bacterium]
MGILIEQKQYVLLPTGEYNAVITDLEETSGEYGPQVKVKFTLTDPDQAGNELTAWASATFTPKSKLYGWTRAAFGADIPKTYNFNSDDLINRPVRLVVIRKTKDDGSEFNRVDGVLPAPVTAAPVPAAPAVTATPPPVTAEQATKPRPWDSPAAVPATAMVF